MQSLYKDFKKPRPGLMFDTQHSAQKVNEHQFEALTICYYHTT